jgi:NAD+ kinase
MKIGLVASFDRPKVGAVAAQILSWGKKMGVEILVADEPERPEDAAIVPRERLVSLSDAIFAVGGDGTILQTARLVGAAEKPILGINAGGLGFLTELSPGNLAEALDRFKNGKYQLEKRSVLQAEIKPTGERFFALNDVVVEKGEVRRLVRLSLWAGGEYICSYASDGLVFATPTGSTAYSLSVGGPILNPKLPAIIVAPISPHTLGSRPIIFDEGELLETELVQPGKEALVTIDGQVSLKFPAAARLTVQKAAHNVSLVKLTGRSFYEVLRTKFHWGVLPGEKQT